MGGRGGILQYIQHLCILFFPLLFCFFEQRFTLVHLGSYNRSLFPTVPEARKFEIKGLADLVSGDDLLPGLWMAVSPFMISHGRGDQGALCHKGINPIQEGST